MFQYQSLALPDRMQDLTTGRLVQHMTFNLKLTIRRPQPEIVDAKADI